MHNKYLRLAAIFGGLAVAIGAFGAHGLKKLTTDPLILDGFSTGAEYQMYHSLALLGIAFIMGKNTDRRLRWAANSFIAGMIFFSGSLYGLSFLKIGESPYTGWLGPVTPLGGLLLILGWAYIVAATLTPTASKRQD
jgi:uncharacterized membrane protein YgdD (TMEM256/DUF423 family)